MRRKLAAIMFVDIVSYSAMMQHDETKAFNQGRRFKSKTKEKSLEFNGKVWQYFGDGALCIFDSAVEAVECAVSLQREFSNDPSLPVRIGIHTGEIIMDNEDVYGDGINVAARIEPICVPGGVYISGKAFDEIKNHKWLKAMSLGHRPMKNIDQQIEVYAVTNQGITLPKTSYVEEMQDDHEDIDEDNNEIVQDPIMHKKWVVSILALFFGVLGAHRFYLGQRFRGILYALGFFITLMGTIESGEPIVAVVPIIAFIDFLTFFAMPRAKFNLRYNTQVIKKKGKKKKKIATKIKTTRVRWKDRPRKVIQVEEEVETYKQEGMRLFKEYDLEEAANKLQMALEESPGDAEIHFLLAKCYSLLEKPHYSINHLAEAIELGFKDVPQIHTDDSFAHVRIQDSFKVFVQNGYKLLRALPPHKADILSEEDSLSLENIELKKKEKIKIERKQEDEDDPIDWIPS